MPLLYIAAGSALGGVARYLLGTAIQKPGHFPWGTLLVNVLGSFAVGFVLRLATDTTHVGPEARAFLAVGFCGGFTTFSTFEYENHALLEDGLWLTAAANVALSLFVGLLAVRLGIVAAKAWL